MQLTTINSNARLTLGIAAVLLAAVAIRAQDSATPAVPYPQDFRTWHHVKTIIVGPEHRSFAVRGGIHHYYANDLAIEGYRTGKFANGAVIVDEAVFTKDGENQAKGIVLEGARRGMDVMVKNDQRYKATGGWGFEHFDGDGRTPTLPADGATKCFECHSKATRDHVFSNVRN